MMNEEVSIKENGIIRLSDNQKIKPDLEEVVTEKVMEALKERAKAEGQAFINPCYSYPIFDKGMQIIRYIDSDVFSQTYDYNLPPEYTTSAEVGLITLISAYAVKLASLRKVLQLNIEKPDSDAVTVNEEKIDEAEKKFLEFDLEGILEKTTDMGDSKVVRDYNREKIVPLKPERYEKQLYCEEIVSKLREDVLPLIESAAKPVIETTNYIMDLLENMTVYRCESSPEDLMDNIRNQPKESHTEIPSCIEEVSDYLRLTVHLNPKQVLSDSNEAGITFYIRSFENPNLRNDRYLYTQSGLIFNGLVKKGYISQEGIALLNFGRTEKEITKDIDNTYLMKVAFERKGD